MNVKPLSSIQPRPMIPIVRPSKKVLHMPRVTLESSISKFIKTSSPTRLTKTSPVAPKTSVAAPKPSSAVLRKPSPVASSKPSEIKTPVKAPVKTPQGELLPSSYRECYRAHQSFGSGMCAMYALNHFCNHPYFTREDFAHYRLLEAYEIDRLGTRLPMPSEILKKMEDGLKKIQEALKTSPANTQEIKPMVDALLEKVVFLIQQKSKKPSARSSVDIEAFNALMEVQKWTESLTKQILVLKPEKKDALLGTELGKILKNLKQLVPTESLDNGNDPGAIVTLLKWKYGIDMIDEKSGPSFKFSNLPRHVTRAIVCVPGHFVCIRKMSNGHWICLDSLDSTGSTLKDFPETTMFKNVCPSRLRSAFRVLYPHTPQDQEKLIQKLNTETAKK